MVIPTLLSLSCKKDHLFGERKILIGNWEWVTTDYQYTCFPLASDWITPDSIETRYGFEISKKERIILEKDGVVQMDFPLEVGVFEESDFFSDGYFFSLYFDDSLTYSITGQVNSDSLLLTEYWPDTFVNQACHRYTNYFVRED